MADAVETVRRYLALETARFDRDRSGASAAALLIRADGDVPFENVLAVLNLCGESGIGISRIEFGCWIDLALLAPEAAGKIGWPGYRLPEGKLDVPLALMADASRVTIDLSRESGESDGFRAALGEEIFEGTGAVSRLQSALEEAFGEKTGVGVSIRFREGVRHADVVRVCGACLGAGAGNLFFEGV